MNKAVSTKLSDRRLSEAKASADRLGARVERRARETAEQRADADREYKRQAKQLRKELRPTRRSDGGGTPHTRRQRRDSGLKSMMDRGLISGEMHAAALEIEQVYLALTAGIGARAQSYEQSARGTPAPMTDRIAWAHAKRYLPWANQLAAEHKAGGRPALAVTIALVVDDAGLRQVSLDNEMRKETAAFLVRRSLLLYAEICGAVRQGATAAFREADQRR